MVICGERYHKHRKGTRAHWLDLITMCVLHGGKKTAYRRKRNVNQISY